jgi:hypothetical protein
MFAMRRKDRERKRARELRSKGRSLREIAAELSVSLSSVSVWVRDVEVPGWLRSRPDAVTTPADALPVRKVPVALDGRDFRRCGKCGRHRPSAQFSRHHQNGRQFWCKPCFKRYFAARGQVHRDQVYAGRRARRAEARRVVAERLAIGCRDCETTERVILEFDHVGPKRGNVSDLVRSGLNSRLIEEEISRCEVVCVSCHRIRTLARLGPTWRTDPEWITRHSSLSPSQRRNMLYVRRFLAASTCLDCGESDIRLLEFDHVFGKTECVTLMARAGCSLDRLQDEVSRCEVRCANCHRRRTIERQLARRSQPVPHTLQGPP